MADNRIEVGDTVRLACETLRMMVNAVDDKTGAVACIWHDETLDLREADIAPENLVIVKKRGA